MRVVMRLLLHLARIGVVDNHDEQLTPPKERAEMERRVQRVQAFKRATHAADEPERQTHDLLHSHR